MSEVKRLLKSIIIGLFGSPFMWLFNLGWEAPFSWLYGFDHNPNRWINK